MLTMEKTADYVKRWVAAFESKDLDRVLAFYTNDVIFHSPLVARLSHDPSGTVQGKAALRAYVKKGFEVFDHIKFTVLDVLRGVDSIAIHYKGITGTHVVEVLFFDKDGVVRESYVHYAVGLIMAQIRGPSRLASRVQRCTQDSLRWHLSKPWSIFRADHTVVCFGLLKISMTATDPLRI